ncbi:hypothetical protein GCM10027168_28180 [Streptomyces capparidis]
MTTEREDGEGQPVLRVVRGAPDATELAAVAAVLAMVAGRGGGGEEDGGHTARRPARWRREDRNRTPVSWASGS